MRVNTRHSIIWPWVRIPDVTPNVRLRLFVVAPDLIHNGPNRLMIKLICIRFGTCEMRFFEPGFIVEGFYMVWHFTVPNCTANYIYIFLSANRIYLNS